MGQELVYDPIEEYEGRLAEHLQSAADHFDELTKQSGVNVEENRVTISRLNGLKSDSAGVQKVISKNKTVRGVCIAAIVVAIVAAIVCAYMFKDILVRVLVPVGAGALAVGLIVLICVKLNKNIKKYSGDLDELNAKISETESEAAEQMQPLNSLFDYGIAEDLLAKTVPQIRVDRFCDIKKTEKLIESNLIDLGAEKCVSEIRTGVSNGNPFVMVGFIDQDFRPQIYEGTLEVRWTVSERGSDGAVRLVEKKQILHATLTKPVPRYTHSTDLFFMSELLPDLSFSRTPVLSKGASDKEIERIVKHGEKELEKKTRDAVKSGGQYNKLANSEFEVLFGASDRQNESQFRMAFTPLAQKNEVKIIKYNDNFTYVKSGQYNIISPAYPETPLPDYFRGIDHDGMRNKFIEFNRRYFIELYFMFAPLMAIPIFFADRPKNEYAFCDTRGAVGEWEVESLANTGSMVNMVRPENSNTDVIVRVKRTFDGEDFVAEATGYSFQGVERVDYVSKRCDNGNYYNVPVHWIEYIPTSKSRLLKASTVSEAQPPAEQSANVGVFDKVILSWD